MHRSLRLSSRFAACGIALLGVCTSARAVEEPAHSAELDAAIIAQAKRHGVPEKLVRRIVMRESKYNARARNHSFWGLMQISYPTAKSMGFKGSPQDLLNPFVNLTYAVPYLANAFVIAGKEEDAAVRLYASGYYFTARSRGLLGNLRTADSDPVRGSGQPKDQPQIVATASDTTPVLATLPLTVPASAARTVQTSDKNADLGVMMVASKGGTLTPPKKWLHDGGSTIIAKGEQRVEQIAAYEKANGSAIADEPHRSSRRPSHKTVTFASIDAPPADAQAYAASGAQDHRLSQTDSQAAISQATVGRATAPSEPIAEAEPTPKRHGSRSARHHAKPVEGNADVANDESASSGADDTLPGRRHKHAPSHQQAAASQQKADGNQPAAAAPTSDAR